MPDDDLPTFFRGVLRVVENASQWVAENGACFVKGNFVLLKVRRRFRLVRFSLRGRSCPSRGIGKAGKYMTNQVRDRDGSCLGCGRHSLTLRFPVAPLLDDVYQSVQAPVSVRLRL